MTSCPTARMDKKATTVRKHNYSGHADDHSEGGFTLAPRIAILAVLAALVIAPLLLGTSRARLEFYAVAIAALLKAHHQAALRRQVQIVTDVATPSWCTVRSGAATVKSCACQMMSHLTPLMPLWSLSKRPHNPLLSSGGVGGVIYVQLVTKYRSIG